MKKWIKRLSRFFLLFATLGSFCQDISLGTWRNHFSFRNARLLTSGDGKIFCAAENGIFFFNQSDNSITKLSKLNGLSDVGATSLAYNETTSTLLIGYASGLVDLVTSDEVKTLREINETNLPGIKTIRDIAVHEERAYLATSFGIVVVSTESQEIVETFRSIGFNGTEVTIVDLEIIGNRIFAIMDNGIQSGSLSSNLLDFNNWYHYDETFSGNYDGFAATDENVYTIFDDNQLAVLNDNIWLNLDIAVEAKLVDLLSHESKLYVLSEDAIYVLENDELILSRKDKLSKNANSFLYEEGFWIADKKHGLIGPDGSSVIPNGPLSDDISHLSFTDQKLFTFYGSTSAPGQETIDSIGYSYFDNHQWHTETIPGFYNLTDVALYNNQLFFSSAGFGLYNASTQEVMNHTNSGLQNGWSALGPVIAGLGKNNNLYLIAHDSIRSLYVMDSENNITGYSPDYVGTEAPVSIDISDNEILWITKSESYGGGIVTLDLESDEYRLISGSSGIPSNVINNLVIDHSDDVWIATAAGPALFPDASFPFDGFSAIEPVFENRLLFEAENILAIAVDGGNRIWISTGSGIYVFNSTLTELVEQFTTTNSPLPSTQVKEFAYNEENGEMYILTERGMASLRTSSSAGSDSHNRVGVFPNPVRPGYTGLVGITGLVTNASVKITDINGKLIRDLEANGGTASWDLLDYNMNRVHSGIYIILSSSADGEETFVGKIAVIN